MFERILVPLDGSARAELILSQIGRIDRREDSELLLMRVVDPILGLEVAEDDRSLMNDMRHAAEQYIDDLVTRFIDRGSKVRGKVIVGLAAEAILNVAEEEGSTMIALTTHGRTGISRWFMGSVAEKVIRASTVPALLMRSFRSRSPGALEPATEEEVPFRKLLVPIDGSPASLAVVAPTMDLARLFKSEILVLHVQQPNVSPGAILPGKEAGSMGPPPEPTSSEKDETTREATELFRQAGYRVTRLTVLGDPAASILDQTLESGIDLIALTTHGRSGPSRWLTGSVTERVLRHALAPLLIVRVGETIEDRARQGGTPQRKKTAPSQ